MPSGVALLGKASHQILFAGATQFAPVFAGLINMHPKVSA